MGFAQVLWKMTGWLGLCVLSAYAFRYLLLFMVFLFALILCWFVYVVVAARLKNDELNSLSVADKRAHYTDGFQFYTIQQTHTQQNHSVIYNSKPLCEELNSLTQRRESYKYEFRNFAIFDGLPDIDPSYEGNITMHIHSSWAGFFPNMRRLNAIVHDQFGFVTALQSSIDRVTAMPYLAPLVSFHMPTGEIASLNFGQKDDSIVISHAYETLCRAFPKAKIVLYGECLGGLRLMNWLKPPLSQVTGIILESPLTSAEQLISFTRNKRINRWLYRAFCLLLPNFNAEIDRHHRYPTDQFSEVPVFVAALEHDQISGPNQLSAWTSRFQKPKSIIVKDTKIQHGQLFRNIDFQSQLASFLEFKNSF